MWHPNYLKGESMRIAIEMMLGRDIHDGLDSSVGGDFGVMMAIALGCAELGHDVTVLNRGKSEQAITSFYKTEKYSYPKKVEIVHA